MANCTRLTLSAAALCICFAAPLRAQEQERLDQQADIILSVSRNTVRWAAVYKAEPERPEDPYFHVRVFERQKGWEPWRFTQLAFHMAVTPRALEASRIDRKARTYAYKDVEIRGAYRRWLADPSARAEVPICDTDILDCIRNLHPK